MPNEVVVTMKGDGSASWAVIHGETVEETQNLLDEALKGPLFQTVAEASTLLAGATKIANGFDPNQQQAEPTKPPYQARTAVGQNQQGNWNNNQSSDFNGTPHPEGKQCPQCGAGIVGKQPKVKKMWTCPNQRSQGDGHYVEWING
jgi:hypothetical protein